MMCNETFSSLFSNPQKGRFNLPVRGAALLVVVAFISTSAVFPSYAWAQMPAGLPKVAELVPLSPPFVPAIIKGLTVHPENPLMFDFIIDKGDSGLEGDALKQESTKIIKYFLAAMTIPKEDLWVNLSPYEKERIITEEFGSTEMGQKLLEQDYMLKRISASLLYPENDLGRMFWERVYAKAQALYGTTEILVNTFNKVWIVPEDAIDKAFVGKGNLTEIAALRRKLRNAEMEVEILKKAVGIFSKPTENDSAL